MFEIIFSCVILISISLIVIFSIIIHDVKNNEYDVKEKSEIGKEAEEKYLKEFPNYTIFSLKSEIEKIADILVDNQSSNRYTELLREKAAKDEKVQELKNAAAQDVDIIKYYKGNLKAKVEFKEAKEYLDKLIPLLSADKPAQKKMMDNAKTMLNFIDSQVK